MLKKAIFSYLNNSLTRNNSFSNNGKSNPDIKYTPSELFYGWNNLNKVFSAL